MSLELSERDGALKQLKVHLLRTQQQMKKYVDSKRRDLKFEVGEWRIGEVAYKLELPAQSKIHLVFHVSLLKKEIGNYQVQGERPKELEVVGTDDIYPDKVLGTRLTVQAGVTIPQSLIQWKNKPLDDVTWEYDAYPRGQFPEFILEDKVGFKEGGVDRDMDDEVGLNYGPKPKVWRVYTRRSGKGIKE
ncbi:hypothetical protein KIW84_010496 [Lathyrus oleraceus]|uniref:Tf2-1-like SH3-like domain-containing protein n=1 Tax=Pisum sativum TaxID=3888 RepID=A0A9D4YLE0_PEA|nr:hypothetical protein KIW84_010496 [Pisum sativum]